MASPRTSAFFRLPLLTAEERAVLRVQLPLVVGLSVLLTIGYALQRELRHVVEHDHLQLLLRGWDGVAWIVWPLAAPVMLMLIRRFPLVRGQVKRNLAGLALGSAVLYFIVTNLRFLLRILPNLWLPDSADLPVNFPGYAASILVLMPLDFLTYSGFFSASLAIDYYFKHRQRMEEALQLKLRTAQLESELAQAELKALRGQLHPHFLFNSFNAVTTLMRQRRNEAAVEVVAQLSTLLRLAIERTGRQELPLGDEVDFIRRYLEIERIRFGDKLRLEFDLDPAALEGLVPNLLLQPLVENAIKHGISRRSTPGTVRVAARRLADRVDLAIENDGPDQPASARPDDGRRGGIGLTNTRSRLEKVYGPDYRLEMISSAEGGMLVCVNLPWRAAAESATPGGNP